MVSVNLEIVSTMSKDIVAFMQKAPPQASADPHSH